MRGGTGRCLYLSLRFSAYIYVLMMINHKRLACSSFPSRTAHSACHAGCAHTLLPPYHQGRAPCCLHACLPALSRLSLSPFCLFLLPPSLPPLSALWLGRRTGRRRKEEGGSCWGRQRFCPFALALWPLPQPLSLPFSPFLLLALWQPLPFPAHALTHIYTSPLLQCVTVLFFSMWQWDWQKRKRTDERRLEHEQTQHCPWEGTLTLRGCLPLLCPSLTHYYFLSTAVLCLPPFLLLHGRPSIT